MQSQQSGGHPKSVPLSNTSRLIYDLEAAERVHGSSAEIWFNVGRFTGNSPVVIASLRRRGFRVRREREAWVLSR